jgi:hypothetical protein
MLPHGDTMNANMNRNAGVPDTASDQWAAEWRMMFEAGFRYGRRCRLRGLAAPQALLDSHSEYATGFRAGFLGALESEIGE